MLISILEKALAIRLPRLLLCLGLALPLGGCGTFSGMMDGFSGWFDGDSENEPARLTDIEPEVTTRRLWRENVGNGQGDTYNRLTPAIEGGVIYAASNNGTVAALSLADGDELWRTRLGEGGLRLWPNRREGIQVSGGVGLGGGMVLLGTVNSGVVALSSESGEVLWESEVASEVLSAPASNGNVVVAQSVDGTLTGLDAETGETLWLYESTVPALSLRGSSSPIIFGNFVAAGFANGTVVSVALDNGTLRWEERVAVPTGTSEIDRLVDIDGEITTGPNNLLVVPSFQGYLASIDVNTGQTRWRVRESTAMSAATGFGNIYVSDERGIVKAYRQGQDMPIWTNEELLRRQLSAPTAFGNYVAVGDFQGYVHLLSQVDGRLVGRFRVGNDGVRSRILARDDVVYVYGNDGTLQATRVSASQ